MPDPVYAQLLRENEMLLAVISKDPQQTEYWRGFINQQTLRHEAEVATVALREMLSERDALIAELQPEGDHPGESHTYEIKCKTCGLKGEVNLSLVGHDEKLTIVKRDA